MEVLDAGGGIITDGQRGMGTTGLPQISIADPHPRSGVPPFAPTTKRSISHPQLASFPPHPWIHVGVSGSAWFDGGHWYQSTCTVVFFKSTCTVVACISTLFSGSKYGAPQNRGRVGRPPCVRPSGHSVIPNHWQCATLVRAEVLNLESTLEVNIHQEIATCNRRLFLGAISEPAHAQIRSAWFAAKPLPIPQAASTPTIISTHTLLSWSL